MPKRELAAEVALEIVGWLCLAASGCGAFLAVNSSLSWIAPLMALPLGILFLGLAAVIRKLYRIEQALYDARPSPRQ